jgi:hypothetical protein
VNSSSSRIPKMEPLSPKQPPASLR